MFPIKNKKIQNIKRFGRYYIIIIIKYNNI